MEREGEPPSAVEPPGVPERSGALTGGRERAEERPGVPERDDDLVALEGLEAELADLDEDLARVDREADEPADPLPGT